MIRDIIFDVDVKMMSEFMINFPAPKIELPYVKMRLIEERKKSFNTDVFGYSSYLPISFCERRNERR